MVISYNEFYDMLLTHIQFGQDFYLSLLKKVIDNPTRYSGFFRLSNAKTKLIQNVTQSNEIKFGDFMEELTTEYLSRLGYTNLEKDLVLDSSGEHLSVDQLFTDGNTIYLVEQKIRDDHDSTKKRGQYANFEKKVALIRAQYPSSKIDAIMWFVDDGLHKNARYYKSEMEHRNINNCSMHLYYGGEFFKSIKKGDEVWSEIVDALTKYRIDNAKKTISIPDFASSDEIYNALLLLDDMHWYKLNSFDRNYELLRKELFSAGNNLERAKKKRN